MRSATLRAISQATLALLLCLAATGCRHRVKPAPPLPVPPATSVPVDHAPEPPEVASVPVTPAPTPSKVPPRRAPRPKKKVAPPPAPAPVIVANAAPPPPPGPNIGALSAGGEDTPLQRQKTADFLAALDKRVAALPSATLQNQKEQVLRIRSFLEEARKALAGGDADGAMTLANKAKVLLDDLQ